MHRYLRVLAKDAEMEKLPDLADRIRACIEAAPGINAVNSVEPHGKGGYAVMTDSVEDLPDGFADYMAESDFLLVF